MKSNSTEIIEKYIWNDLSVQERKDFEEELQTNSSLRKEVDFHESIISGSEALGRDELRKELEIISREESVPPKKDHQMKYLLIGLIAILFIAVYFITSNSVNTKDKEQLYALYFQPNKMENSTRSSNQDQYSSIKNNFNDQNYSKVLKEAASLDLSKLPSDILIAIGYSNIDQENYENASNCLTIISQRGDFNFLDESDWLHALILLKQNENSKAISILQNISKDSNHDYQIKAQKLLKELPVLD